MCHIPDVTVVDRGGAGPVAVGWSLRGEMPCILAPDIIGMLCWTPAGRAVFFIGNHMVLTTRPVGTFRCQRRPGSTPDAVFSTSEA